MINIEVQKKILFIVICTGGLFTSGVFGQCCGVTYTVINQNGGFSLMYSSDFANDTYYEQQRQARANNINLYQANQIQVSRFNQKLIISANVVHKMNETKTQVSKYPYAFALYKKSLESYKKLESISAAAAQNVRLNKSIDELQSQQTKIMNEAVDDYHKGQYIQELGDNKTKIIQEEIMTFESERCLTKKEKSELKTLKDQIRDAQNRIAQLHQSGQSMEKIKDQLKNDYHIIAQTVNSMAKITEKALEVYVPNQKIVKVINVTQNVFDTYVDEAIANGKSPSDAIKKALEEGYKELKKEQQNQKMTPSEKKIEMIKQIYKQAETEYNDWQKMDKNRTETMKKINETIEFTNDLVQRNQRLIDAAKLKGEKMLNRRIDGCLKRRLN